MSQREFQLIQLIGLNGFIPIICWKPPHETLNLLKQLNKSQETF